MAAEREPKMAHGEAELVYHIWCAIVNAPFSGEGHHKMWVRLRRGQGVRAGQFCGLGLMREHVLLASLRPGPPLGPRAHDGRIVAEIPDAMWCSDANTARTPADETVTVFAVLDHHTLECLGLHAAKPVARFEALEPIRQTVRTVVGVFERGVADVFHNEIAFLGIASSSSFVHALHGNGIAE